MIEFFIYIYLARIVTQERERDNIRHHAVLGKKTKYKCVEITECKLIVHARRRYQNYKRDNPVSMTRRIQNTEKNPLMNKICRTG